MQRMIRHLAILALAVPAGVAAQGRALTIEDYYQLTTVGAPRMSPDGRWVAWTVSRRIESTNGDSIEVWLASSTGTPAARRVSPAGTPAGSPQWEGARLTFAAGGRRVAIQPSRPDSVIEHPGVTQQGVASALRAMVSPTGRHVAVLRSVAPARREPPALSAFEQRHEERFRGRQFDWLDFQRDGESYPVPNRADPQVMPPLELFVTADGDTTARQLTSLGLRPTGVDWNPAGTALVFTADVHQREERKYAAAAVFLASLEGQTRRLTTGDRFHHTGARFAPDGRSVLVTRQLSTNAVIAEKLDHGGPTDLILLPVGGGTERNLTEGWDLLPSGATWSPDGRFVYFTAGIGGAVHLFRVPASGGAVQQVTTGERRILSVDFDSAMTRMTYLVGRIEAPAEVHVAQIDGSGERRISDANTAFTREIALGRADRLLFDSKDGTRIEGWLLRPHGYRPDGGPYPLVVSNHGGPHSADGYLFDFKNQYFAANGYFVLEVNFRSSTGYGEKFLWGTWGAWGDRDGEDVMAGIDAALARYPIDRTRVATMGHSYGGFMTNWLITQYPDRFAAAVTGAGIVNWVSDYGTADIARTKETEFFGYPWEERARDIMIRQSPLTHAGRVRTPTLFIHGEVDERVPYSEAEQMYVALKKLGVPAKMIQYQGMAHGINGSWNNVHRMLNEMRWIDQYLRPRVSP
jgi:dipeptidyl aminopeptidase/acylaminoacyl peptidase